MAEWKKIIVSGSQAELAGISGSGLTTNRLLTANAGGAIASSGITLSGNSITSTGASSVLSGSFSGSFQGDGSGLTGVAATSFDIDALSAGTAITGSDQLIYSEGGTEKKISFALLSGSIIDGISGDVNVTTAGASTIADNAVDTDAIAHSLGEAGVHQFTGSFSGSFTGTTDLPDLTDGDGIVDFTYDGSGTATVAVDTDGDTIIAGTNGIKVADGQIGTTQIADSLGNMGENSFTGSFSGSFVGDGTNLTGIATTLRISGSSGNDSVSLGNEDLSIIGTGNQLSTTVTDNQVQIGLTNNVTIPNNLTVTNDLIVQGTQTILNTANLAIEDKFILLNSGSSTNTDESGIIFGGSNGSANNGAALIWNGDYNSNDGRLAVANSVNANANSAAVSYYVAGVTTGSAALAETAQADHPGNIRIDGSDIYIYV